MDIFIKSIADIGFRWVSFTSKSSIYLDSGDDNNEPIDPTTRFGFGLFMTLGILISYIPQIVKLILARKSSGISVWFLALGMISCTATVSSIIISQTPALACCKYSWSSLHCMANTLGITQLSTQFLCYAIIFCLFFHFYPKDLRYIDANSISNSHVDIENGAGVESYTTLDNDINQHSPPLSIRNHNFNQSGIDASRTVRRHSQADHLSVEQSGGLVNDFRNLTDDPTAIDTEIQNEIEEEEMLSAIDKTYELPKVNIFIGIYNRFFEICKIFFIKDKSEEINSSLSPNNSSSKKIHSKTWNQLLIIRNMIALATLISGIIVILSVIFKWNKLMNSDFGKDIENKCIELDRTPDLHIPIPDGYITSAIAGIFGIFASMCAVVQFLPQLILTYQIQIVGALSIPTMLMQCPGSFMMVISLSLQPGANWTSWMMYFIGGIMQGMLLMMCIFIVARDRSKTENDKLLDSSSIPSVSTENEDYSDDDDNDEQPLLAPNDAIINIPNKDSNVNNNNIGTITNDNNNDDDEDYSNNINTRKVRGTVAKLINKEDTTESSSSSILKKKESKRKSIKDVFDVNIDNNNSNKSESNEIKNVNNDDSIIENFKDYKNGKPKNKNKRTSVMNVFK